MDLAHNRQPLKPHQHFIQQSRTAPLHIRQFVQKNHDLIVKWYQDEHLSWPVIAARLNQCLRGGGISAALLQTTLPHLRRVPMVSSALEELTPAQPAAADPIPAPGWLECTQVQALEEHVHQQSLLLRIQQDQILESANRRARLEELVSQLLPLVRDAEQCAEQLPRTHPTARAVRERLQQLHQVLDSF